MIEIVYCILATYVLLACKQAGLFVWGFFGSQAEQEDKPLLSHLHPICSPPRVVLQI